ncbi:serine/threonine-protein kinase [Streptomyces sp. DG2A-72]|uniref:serine/threonine-protein kinase n=1 Tax=Streptomyces sp. DG2A-72 TaxID=3051386 RepID=UPI00265B8FE3|nr:serine/threonine-protein kinase [Streptomyces sp. DG2A-72]MDO0930941.1 serine/threonine-protein kinase [Streptomyces sp. DG2A-72]
MNAPGDMVDGRFELLGRLGSGGMGTVWRARDTVLHREVALKAVRPDAEDSPVVRERVMREARALARLNSPHVVTVHQIIEADPHPWIVMELVPGISLQQRLADGPLVPVEAARIGRQVLSGLRTAHAAGIRHRDVKPANILLAPDGTAVLTDFGIAALQGATALTATGEFVGSPEYIAPECLRGRDNDPASDLWSLGLVLYVCVEGVSPLRRASTLGTLAAVLEDPVPPPVRSGPLAPVLQSLLVRDPAARPRAEQLDAMLAQVESGTAPHWAQPTLTAALTPTTTPTPPPAPVVTPAQQDPTRPELSARRRTPVLVAVAAVVAVGAAVALALALPGAGSGDEEKKAGAERGATASTPSAPDARTTPSPTPTPVRTPSAAPPGSASPSAPAGDSGWIAQLHSEPLSTGTAARDQRLAAIRESVPEAVYVRSDDFASLRPGYWVFYAPGPFADGRAALSFCAERGRTTPNTCMGRYLSTSPADFALQCRPPETSPTGRCTRATG